jgi:hypothetical protein
MAQAESLTTAIRELMSRGQTLKSTNVVRAAHTEFIAALAGNASHPIRSDANWEALEGRAGTPSQSDFFVRNVLRPTENGERL